jgi:hypothetical protein
MFVRFPPDARWNPQRSPVEFSIGIGEYEGVVRVPQRVFQHLLAETLHRNDAWKPTIFIGLGSNSSPERKVRRRLTDDGNVEITGRDLRSVRPTLSMPDRLLLGCSMKAAQQAVRDAERRFPVQVRDRSPA